MAEKMNRDFSQNVVGIIAEYNPFHNGHEFHIRRAKELCRAPYCVVAMSGDFVQRGEPAIFDKYARTFMALWSGADLVVEVPPHFAVASAEDFASCGIALLHHLGVVSHVCFGSECGDVSALMDLAEIFIREPQELSASIKSLAACGLSYPKAREMALARCLSTCQKAESPACLLSEPNNILGVEYCKALLKRNSPMIPVTVLRKGAGYRQEELSEDFSSATAIRKAIFNQYEEKTHGWQPWQDSQKMRACPPGRPPFSPAGQEAGKMRQRNARADLSGHVPLSCLKFIDHATPVFVNDFSLLLSYRLLELSGQAAKLETFADVSPDLALRIKKQVLEFSSFEERIAALKTRQHTYTRISRSLMHILLGMTKEDILARRRRDYASYIRVLGFRKESAPLLGAVKRASKLPLVTKTADAPRILPPAALEEFQQDLHCSHIYQSVLTQKGHVRPKNEYTRSVVLL